MNKTNIGVIVGRFQTPRLTPGHVHLINTALLQNDAVLLFVGVSPLKNSRKQPLDYVWRNSMIQSDSRLYTAGRRLIIKPLKDRGDDNLWTEDLENEIKWFALEEAARQLTGTKINIRLYGSRDSSFLTGFKKEYEHVNLIPFADFSATEIREQIARRYPSGRESDDAIREGIIFAAYNRFPMVVSTVDNAIFDVQEGQVGVWFGSKPGERKRRLIGGFAEPTSASDEEDAIREAEEETGLVVAAPKYLGNYTIDDWRFRGEVDKIRTRFFATTVVGGEPKENDDIAEIEFIPLRDLTADKIIQGHQPLIVRLLEWLKTNEGIAYMSDVSAGVAKIATLTEKLNRAGQGLLLG